MEMLLFEFQDGTKKWYLLKMDWLKQIMQLKSGEKHCLGNIE